LDQLAFTERVTRASSRAKEEEARREGKEVTSGSSARGFGFFGGGGSKADTGKGDEERGRGTEEQDEEDEGYIDPGLDEAAAAIFYAWPRFPREVRELTTLRTQLLERWGKDFVSLAQDNKAAIKVPERLIKSLRVRPPPQELAENYLREIAKAYGVVWPKGEVKESLGTPPEFVDDEGDNGSSGDVPEENAPSTPQRPDIAEKRRVSEAELSRATPPRDIGPHDGTGRSPVSVAPPGPTTDNLHPRVKIPGSDTQKDDDQARRQTVEPKKKASNGIPEMDEMARRFAALKR
jgi:vacuolar protein sorting-associated protein IST1